MNERQAVEFLRELGYTVHEPERARQEREAAWWRYLDLRREIRRLGGDAAVPLVTEAAQLGRRYGFSACVHCGGDPDDPALGAEAAQEPL